MRRFRIAVSIAALAVVIGQAPTPVHAAAADSSVHAVAQQLVALLVLPSAEATATLRARVDAGVPPGALVVMLDAYRAAPRADLVDIVKSLASYRRVEVRARAIAAWAALDGHDAIAAIQTAAGDTEPTVRKLAVALAAKYPSMRADEIVAALLVDDPDLAAELAADTAPLVPEDPR